MDRTYQIRREIRQYERDRRFYEHASFGEGLLYLGLRILSELRNHQVEKEYEAAETAWVPAPLALPEPVEEPKTEVIVVPPPARKTLGQEIITDYERDAELLMQAMRADVCKKREVLAAMEALDLLPDERETWLEALQELKMKHMAKLVAEDEGGFHAAPKKL